MSTIQGSIMLMDAMSTPLNNIVGAINTLSLIHIYIYSLRGV